MGLFWKLIARDKISQQLSTCINPDNNREKKKVFKILYEPWACFDYSSIERKCICKNSWYLQLNYKEHDITQNEEM